MPLPFKAAAIHLLLFFTSFSFLVADNIPDSTTNLIADQLEEFPEKSQFSIGIIDSDYIEFIGFIKGKDTVTHLDNVGNLFEIGSISKVFTSLILSGMFEDGYLDLDDPISKYLNFKFEDDRVAGITLTQLANHTSGLPRMPSDFRGDPSNPYADNDLETLWISLRNTKLESAPGSKMAYSNLGVASLAQILCQHASKSYEELLHIYVFDLFDMNHSSSVRSSLDQDRLVEGLGIFGTKTSYWDLNAYEGAGALLSNSEDMIRFMRGNFGEESHVKRIRRETHRISGNSGIGLGIFNVENNQPVYWHNGGTGGFRSCMTFDPQNQKGVILLSNISAFNAQSGKLDQLCFKLLESLY